MERVLTLSTPATHFKTSLVLKITKEFIANMAAD